MSGLLLIVNLQSPSPFIRFANTDITFVTARSPMLSRIWQAQSYLKFCWENERKIPTFVKIVFI